MATNPEMLLALYQLGFIPGGESMFNGETIQTQIALAGERTLNKPLITGWVDGKGNKYSTSVIEQLRYNAQGIGRIETRQAVHQELLQQIANAVSKGVDVAIDYDRIEATIKANMPTYELIPKEPTE